MPRNVNPSTLIPGAGLAPAGTVEDNSLRYPERDVDPLRAHLHDPVRAHMASSIGIVDAGHYYTSDNVEGALQELGGGNAANYAARQNGWVSAGTSNFATAAVVGGATVTLSGSWVAITNTGLVDVSGFGITIAGGAGNYWIYLDSTTGTLVQLAAPAVPDITNDEDIPVGVFAFNGAAITGQRDARFFVRNDNRKITYTVRGDGSEEDANSEGAFATIEGAFSWLQAYTTGAGGVSQKSRLTLRGAFTVTKSLTVPVDDLEIVGEDGAEITFNSGAATELFDIDAHTNVSFRNISFVCDTAGFTAAITDLTGPTVGLTVDRCQFSGTGGNTWVFPISLTNGFTDLLVSNCETTATGTAAFLDSPAAFESLGVTLTNNTVNGVFFGGFGIFGNVSRISVSGNRIDGYLGAGTEPTAVGITVGSNATSGENPSDAVVTGNVVYRCAVGINIEGRYDERAVNSLTVAVIPADGDTITVTDAAGVAHVLTARTTVTVADEFLIGGSVNATAANIITAINDTANSFYADVVHAVSGGGAVVGFYAVPQGAVGNAFTLATSAPAKITIPSASFANGFDGSVQGAIVSQNTVTNCAFSSAGGGGFSYTATGAIGIGMNFTRDCRVVDNDVREIGILIDNTGAPVLPSITGPVVDSVGITVWNSTRYAVERNTVLNTTGTSGDDQRGILLVTGDQGAEATFTNVTVDASVCDNKIGWSLEGNFAATAGATYGTKGIQSLASIITAGADSASANYLVSGMKVNRNTVTNCGGPGIEALTAERSLYQLLSVDQNTVNGCSGYGIGFDIQSLAGGTAGASGFQGVSVTGNSLATLDGFGVILFQSRNVASNQFLQFNVQGNRITNTSQGGFVFLVGSGVDAANMPNVSQIDILDNEMLLVGTNTALDSAISFFADPNDNLTISSVLENIRVNRNSILDSGGGAAHAIEFALANWEPLNVEVSGNTVSGTSGNPSPGGGFRMNVVSTNATPTNYGITGVEAADNNFFLSGDLPAGTAQIVVTAPFVGGETLEFYFPPTGAAVSLTAVAGAPTNDEFQITGAINTDAVAIRTALNNASNSFSDFLTASITTAGTVNLVADANMPGSMCGMAGPVQTGVSVTTITGFVGTGVGTYERRATFQLIVNSNVDLNPGDTIDFSVPGALTPETLTFIAVGPPAANQVVIGANAAATVTNLINAINSDIPKTCTASLYPDAAASGRIVLLTAGDDIPGRLGNYAQVSVTIVNSNAIYLGNDDQYFSYGEDDMINGVSIEADGVVTQANIQRNTVTYSVANATLNRRPAFIRAKQATYPYSLDIPALGSLTVAAQGVPPVGVGDGQTFTIDDGLNPAVTFEYVVPATSAYNPANVPVSFDVGTPLSGVTKATVTAIQSVIAAGRLSVNVASANGGTGVINLTAIPQASVSGSITVSGLPLVAVTWVGGSVVVDANPFGRVYGLNIEDNDFLGGIGSQVEILNGCVLRGLSFSGNRVSRPDLPVPACDPGVHYSGYYHGFSTFNRSGFITRTAVPLSGVDQLVGIVATDNDFSNLGHGAISVYKDETKNNLYPFVLDTSFTNNRVYNCGLSAISPTMLALQTWGYFDLGTMASAVISGNNIENSVVLSNGGRPTSVVGSTLVYTDGALSAHILVQPYLTATDINVRGNTILGGSSTALAVDSASQVAAAISMFAGAGVFCRDFSVTDNRIHGVSLAAASNTMPVTSHIFAGSPLSPLEGGASLLTGLEISRNMVVEASSPYEFWDSSTTALSLAGAIPLVGGITVNGMVGVLAMSIDNNIVDVTRQTISVSGGPPPVYMNGHILVASGVVGSVGGVLVAGSISGNQLNVSNDNAIGTFLKYTYGVFCQMSCSNVKVDANKVILLGSDTGGFFFGNGGGLWNTFLLGSSISNNSITARNNTPGGDQRFLGIYTDIGVSGSEFCNNTFASTYSNPFDNGIRVDGADLTQVVVSGNSIVAASGVYVSGTVVDSSFTGNSVAGDSTPSAQGFYFTDTVTNSTLSANTVRYATDGFQFDSDVLGSAITGNGARDVTNGFVFGNGFQVLATTISGNSVSPATNGFVFTGCTLNSPAITGNAVYGDGSTATALGGIASVPASGTCTGNTGRNLGGGNTWDTWASTGPRVAVYRDSGAGPLND